MVLTSRYTSRPFPEVSLAQFFRDTRAELLDSPASGKILRRVLIAQDPAAGQGP
jgi:hypothetical protein